MQSDTLMNLITGILEDSMKLLKKVEKNIDLQNNSLKSLVEKFNSINDNLDRSFEELINVRLKNIFETLYNRLDLIDYDKLIEYDEEIDAINKILQRNFQLQTISLMKELVELNMKWPKAGDTQFPRRISSRTSISMGPIQKPISPIQVQSKSASAELEGDWSESELEGGEIFERIIVGWKRRDFEKAQGTKEIFMRAWKKLSSYDRAQIKNGAWSQALINKIKMLGRK